MPHSSSTYTVFVICSEPASTDALSLHYVALFLAVQNTSLGQLPQLMPSPSKCTVIFQCSEPAFLSLQDAFS